MQKRCSAGEFRVTAKYLMLHVRIIDLINQLHFAINIRNYYLGLETWEELMMLSFTMNKQNYARYGTYYLTQMGSLDSTSPGAHEEIQEKGISVCRNNTSVRQSIDGTGEQAFMRNSKTAGNYMVNYLMCSGEIFSEEANIFLFAILDHTKFSYLKLHEFLLSLYYLIERNYLSV